DAAWSLNSLKNLPTTSGMRLALASRVPDRGVTDQQAPNHAGEAAERENPGGGGDVKEHARRLKCRNDAAQRSDESAQIDQLRRQRCRELLAGVPEAGAGHDRKRHQ